MPSLSVSGAALGGDGARALRGRLDPRRGLSRIAGESCTVRAGSLAETGSV